MLGIDVGKQYLQYLQAGIHSQTAPARLEMNNLLYGDNSILNGDGHILPSQAQIAGLDGDYVQPANKFGLVEPLVLDYRGHQGDDVDAFYRGGKLPNHIAASTESGFAPNSGAWKSNNDVENTFTYTPSIEQISSNGGDKYTKELVRYFSKEEAPDGHTLAWPAPMSPIYLSPDSKGN